VSERYAAARADPFSPAAVGPLCRAYHANMLFEQADRCYAIVEAIDGDWQWTYARALLLAERGGGVALQPMLVRVTQVAPRFGPAWLRLGDVEFKAGRYDEALTAWARAGELGDPDRPASTPVRVVEVPLAAHAALGTARVALARGKPDDARVTLEAVVARTPSFGPAVRLLADAYRALGREAEAAQAVYRASRLPPYAPYADPIIDDLARESRQATLLLRMASEATLSANGPWSEYLTRRAVEFEPDNPDAALGLFERYHRMVPGDFLGLAHIGSCLSALGRFAEAEGYFRRALAGVDDPLTHFNLGLLLVVTGRAEEGIREYERALERNPMLSDARSNLATALARRGQTDRAARELAFVVEHDPDNAMARTNYGLILMDQGRPREARVQLVEALRLAPTSTTVSQALALLP
jgi:tetratricopeptide (TPR) repeat protein